MEEEEVGVDGWLRRKEDEAALVRNEDYHYSSSIFATSALPSLPLTITDMIELGFTKRISKI